MYHCAPVVEVLLPFLYLLPPSTCASLYSRVPPRVPFCPSAQKSTHDFLPSSVLPARRLKAHVNNVSRRGRSVRFSITARTLRRIRILRATIVERKKLERVPFLRPMARYTVDLLHRGAYRFLGFRLVWKEARELHTLCTSDDSNLSDPQKLPFSFRSPESHGFRVGNKRRGIECRSAEVR